MTTIQKKCIINIMTRKEIREKNNEMHMNAPQFQIHMETPSVLVFEEITTQIQRKHHSSGYNFIKVWGRKDGILYYLGQGDVIDFKVMPNSPITSDADYDLNFISIEASGNYHKYFRAKFLVNKHDIPFASTIEIAIVQRRNN